MKKLLFILIAIVITFTSCSPQKASPKDIVERLCGAEARLPAGTAYSTDADEDSPHFLRRELLAVTYGIPLDFDGIESGAIWLSGFRHPCEFAVFLCKDANAAEDISLFFNQRIRMLKKSSSISAHMCKMTVEEYTDYVSGATVTVSGRYVALIISSDPRTARRAFLKSV